MPIYVYRCPECDGTVELQRKIAEMDDPVYCRSIEHDDDEATVRPARPRMVRVMTAPSGLFPGATDWRR